jgi:hypothetical protein
MSLLISALIILLVAALCIYALRILSPDAKLTQFGSVAIIIIAIILIIQRSGFA